MKKVRIWQVARGLELPSWTVIQHCRRLGINVKEHHQSSISDDDHKRLLESLQRCAANAGNMSGGTDQLSTPKHPTGRREFLRLTAAAAAGGLLVEGSKFLANYLYTEVRREPVRQWDPRIDDADFLFDTFAEHEERARKMWVFTRILPGSKKTKAVQVKQFGSQSASLLESPEGRRIFETYGRFGNARRAYCTLGRSERIIETLLMQRQDIERLVHRKHPFEKCMWEEVGACFEHLKNCISAGGVRLLLIGQENWSRDPLLELDLRAVESLVMIGDTVSIRFAADWTATCSERQEDIRTSKVLLGRLLGLVDHGIEVPSVLAELDRYQRQIDERLRHSSISDAQRDATD